MQRPDECRLCPLDTLATGFTKPEGSGSLGVLIMGESAGDHEVRDNLPFRPQAPAGSLLQRAIERSGFDRSQFRITNVIQCQPPHNVLEGADYEVGSIEHCKVHRESVINAMKPRAILALGNVALRTLTGWSGDKRTVSYLRGYVLDSLYGPVIPGYHPSFLRRGAGHLFGVLCHDLRRAVQVAQHGSETLVANELEYRHNAFCITPSIQIAEWWLNILSQRPNASIAYDIETEDSQYRDEDADDDSDVPRSKRIVSIQFSLGQRSGIFMPWVDPYIAIAKAILALPNDKWGFNNWQFDDPLLKANGAEINGVNHDLMWAWHHLQPDLPRGLQFVSSFYGYPFPWKHLAQSEPEFYGICDVESLHYIAPRIFDDLKRRGIWNGYDRHVLQLQPILLKMSDRGLPVDPAAHAEFSKTLAEQRDQLFLDMQHLVPDELKSIMPRQGYKNPKIADKAKLKQPEIGEKWVERQFKEVNHDRASSRDISTGDIRYAQGDTSDSAQPETNQQVVREGCSAGSNQASQAREMVGVKRWCRQQPFTPSNQQLIQYMKFKGHKVPINFKSSKETTSKIELERLARSTKDILYSKVLEYRELSTLLTNHMKNWLPGADGRVHPTFTFAPATGQLSARNPNSQNAPQHTKLANDFKMMIVAKPSHVLLSFDYKSFHALTLGFESQDPAYMRLARLDIHSYLTAHMEKFPNADRCLEWDDSLLAEYLAEVKSRFRHTRDKKAKPAILGYGFGLKERHFYDMNREHFKDLKAARAVLAMLDDLFPKEVAYRKAVAREAHDRGYLNTRYGYTRYFYDVFHWDRKRSMMVPGEDHEAAIAFRPANDAFGMKKEAMLDLSGEADEAEQYGLLNEVHDALLFECPYDLADQAINDITDIMEEPSEVLIDPVVSPDGLICRVSASIGHSWNKMEEINARPISARCSQASSG